MRHVGGAGRAERSRDVEPVRAPVGDVDLFDTPHPRREEGEESDRACADDRDRVRGRHRRDGDRMQRDGERLDEGRLLERDVRGQAQDRVLREHDGVGIGAIEVHAQATPIDAHVRPRAPALIAGPAGEDRAQDDVVARDERGDARADARDHARGLVTHDDARPAATRRPEVAMDIGSADPGRAHADDDLAGGRQGIRPLLEPEPLRPVVHERSHRCPALAVTAS